LRGAHLQPTQYLTILNHFLTIMQHAFRISFAATVLLSLVGLVQSLFWNNYVVKCYTVGNGGGGGGGVAITACGYVSSRTCVIGSCGADSDPMVVGVSRSDVPSAAVAGSDVPTSPAGSYVPSGPGASYVPSGPGASYVPSGPGGSDVPTALAGSYVPSGPGASYVPSGPAGSDVPSGPGGSYVPSGPGGSYVPSGPAGSDVPSAAAAGSDGPSAPAASEVPSSAVLAFSDQPFSLSGFRREVEYSFVVAEFEGTEYLATPDTIVTVSLTMDYECTVLVNGEECTSCSYCGQDQYTVDCTNVKQGRTTECETASVDDNNNDFLTLFYPLTTTTMSSAGLLYPPPSPAPSMLALAGDKVIDDGGDVVDDSDSSSPWALLMMLCWCL
jgi:hypothetical protein